jgi:hypothetical protein
MVEHYFLTVLKGDRLLLNIFLLVDWQNNNGSSEDWHPVCLTLQTLQNTVYTSNYYCSNTSKQDHL